MKSESFVFLLFFTLILIIPVCRSSTCMADCTSELTQRPPSLYEQYCCNDNNTGKTFKIRQNNVLKIIFCSDNSPISCEMYRTFLNCTDIFKHNRSAISGYYTMRAPNGSLISVYCDDNAFNNCSQVFKENTSSPSGYYTMRAPNGSLIFAYCDLSFINCSQILNEYSFAPSGYYTIQAPNGSLILIYCDMEGSNCYDKGGWMRVGYHNMSEPGATCPHVTLHQYNNIDHGLCSRPVLSSGSLASVFFSTYGVNYNKVCGRVIRYQYGSSDGFPPDLGGPVLINNPNIDHNYIDGVSITYGNNPCKHAWTLGVGNITDDTSPNQYNCPCNTGNTETTVPSFVGSNYYCESGIASGQ